MRCQPCIELTVLAARWPTPLDSGMVVGSSIHVVREPIGSASGDDLPVQQRCRLRGYSVQRASEGDGFVSETQQRSPVIWRCARCMTLVHPSDEETPAAWCPRCRRITEATRDGG
jgi:hypothetical protein